MLFRNVAFILINIRFKNWTMHFSGLVHDDLRTFLDTNLPKERKRAKVILGVGDSRIGWAINELFSVTCQHTGIIPEFLRG